MESPTGRMRRSEAENERRIEVRKYCDAPIEAAIMIGPPLGLSIHPDKMSGPLLPQTAMGGWLALPGKESLWCAIESRLKASPHQCPLFRSFPSHVLSLIHNPGQLVTQPHTTYTQTKHIRLWVLNWHQTCVVCVKK